MSEKKNYRQILKSSSVIGGAEGINILLGMVRVKFVAVLLGPAGVGLLGMFGSIQSLVAALSGLGIGSSGVRDVAEASGSGDDERIGRTVLTLRRVCWLTGAAGALILAVFAVPISRFTFQSSDYAWHVAMLGLAILMGSVAGGQMALIQGMRRIGDLARLNIIGSVIGTLVAIGFYTWLGLEGIIPALLTMSAFGLAASLWFSRRVQVPSVKMSWGESLSMATGLIGLGIVFMYSGLMSSAEQYILRMMIIDEISLAAVGVFGAAFKLSGMAANFILGAMGANYYPALTAISDDHGKMRALVNQQTEIGLLLAAPLLMGMLAAAPWIIQIFYTQEFSQASGLLQWFVIGCLGRVISWPMGFVMLAKGAKKLFFFSSTQAPIIHVCYAWIGLKWRGLEGVAIAFCLLYVTHTLIVYVISRHLISFKWSASAFRLILMLVPIAILNMVICQILPLISATIVGSLLTIFAGIFCLRGLCSRLGDEHKWINKICMIPGMRKILYT